MTVPPSVNASWWWFEEGLAWIASFGFSPEESKPFELDFDPFCNDFDAPAFFRGLSDLTGALVDGDLPAHASIDTAPVCLVSPPFWKSVNFIPYWDYPAIYYQHGFARWPKILILSQSPFRPDALLDHSERSHLVIPSAKNLKGERGYYRVISDVILSRADVIGIWQGSNSETSAPNFAPKTRNKRETAIKIEESLAMMSNNRLSLAGSPQGLSYNEIAEQLVNRWYDEGDKTVREIGAVAKAVSRYYERRTGGN